MTFERALHDPNVIAALCGLGAFAVVVLVWMAFVESDPLTARLQNIANRRDELRAEERKKKFTRREKDNTRNDWIKNLVHKLKLEKGKQTNELRLKLARAGYRSRDAVAVYLFARLAAPLGLGVFGFLVFFALDIYKMQPVMKPAALAGVILLGLALPALFLKNQSQKREDILRLGMPDALDFLVICAEAGLSLDSALDRVSREIGASNPELAEEIGLTSIELGFLPDRSKALQNLADRVPLPGVLALVNTLIQTEKYGTPLAQALRVLSSEMREERMMAAEAKAAKLPATLTVPMILFILPPLFVVLLGPAMLRLSSYMH